MLLYPLSLKEGNAKKPVYEMHKWWARRLGINFRFLLIASVLDGGHSRRVINELYARHKWPDIVVCDPFMGGGTSIVEASKMRMRTIGIDIDPVAWFVTKKELDFYDEPKFLKSVHAIEKDLKDLLKGYYKTKLADGRMYDVVYYFWVDYPTCPSCRRRFEAHHTYELSRDDARARSVVFCKSCHAVRTVRLGQKSFRCKRCSTTTVMDRSPVKHGTYSCPHCRGKGELRHLARPGRPIPKKLFAVEYWDDVEKCRKYSRTSAFDVRLFREVRQEFNRLRDYLPFPRDKIPTDGRSDKRPVTYGHSTYSSLFNERQLLCLSLIYERIMRVRDVNVREYLMLAFSDSLASNNMLCAYAYGYRKLTPLFGLHSYRYISRPVEGNVWGATEGRGSFRKCLDKIIRGKAYCEMPYEFKYSRAGEAVRTYTGERIGGATTDSYADWRKGLSDCLLVNGSAEEMGFIPDSSVDVVLTDPPYFNNLSYSDLSDFYWAWLKGGIAQHKRSQCRALSPRKEALYVSRLTDAQIARYASGLSKAFAECARILRDDGVLVFTFHHSDRRAWVSLATALVQAGFIVANVFPMLSEGRSGFHTSDGNIKWDSVFVCHKSKDSSGPKHSGLLCIKKAVVHADAWATRLVTCSPAKFNGVDKNSLLHASLVSEITRSKVSIENIDITFDLLPANLIKRRYTGQRTGRD